MVSTSSSPSEQSFIPSQTISLVIQRPVLIHLNGLSGSHVFAYNKYVIRDIVDIMPVCKIAHVMGNFSLDL